MNALKATMNRAKQTVEEKLGDAKKTELDSDLQKALVRIDDVKAYTQKTLTAVEAFLQPDPTQRVLEGFKNDGANKAESVGQEMSHLAAKLGSDDSYGQSMVRGAEAFTKLGQAERERLKSANTAYVLPVKEFLNGEVKTLASARSDLENKRLDMDSLKAKQGKGDTELDDKYKASVEAYQLQVAEVRKLVGEVEAKVPDLKAALKGLVTSEMEYLEKSQQVWKDFQKQLNK